jgi:hypothetical protein
MFTNECIMDILQQDLNLNVSFESLLQSVVVCCGIEDGGHKWKVKKCTGVNDTRHVVCRWSIMTYKFFMHLSAVSVFSDSVHFWTLK